MKILYLHQYFNTPSMSGGTRSYEMARRLVAAGHEVHVVTSDCQAIGRRSGGWYQTEEAGIRVHWLPVPYSNTMRRAERLRAFFRFAFLAGPKGAALRPDVVFATSTPLTIALPAVFAARRNRVPMVFEVRDLWPEMPIAVGALKSPLSIMAARRLERFAYANACQIVALSPGMKDGVVATGYPAGQVTVIPNSCDFTLFEVGPEPGRAFRARHAWLGDRRLIVYTGTLGQINHVEYLANLAGAVIRRDPEIRFLVVGTGKEEARVRHVAEERGVLDRNFFMIPSIPKQEVPSVLSAADLATSLFKVGITEMWANSANKFFDALASSTPVAINYGGWQAELLEETGSGLRLADDVNVAAETLVASLRDEVWLAEAGAAAGRLGRERFSRDLLASQLETILSTAPALTVRSAKPSAVASRFTRRLARTAGVSHQRWP